MNTEQANAAPRLPKPESLEAKFKLLALLPYDKRVKRRHVLVFGFILDWFHSKYGDALASVRHVSNTIKERDPAGVGIYSGDVHSALVDLTAWGYLNQEKGTGRRASRYVPKWALVCSVRENPNATEDARSVRETESTDVRETPNTTVGSVRESENEDPLTGPGDQTRGPERGIDCAAPLAPPPDGLAATGAGTAQDEKCEPFEQLWLAYDYKRKKREARAAYGKLAPDAELHAAMVEAAGRWRASWAAQNKADAPRFHLHKWIEREEYECDPPTAYKPKERKTKERAAQEAPSRAPGKMTETLRIIGAEPLGSVFQADYGVRLRLDGAGSEQDFVLNVFNEDGAAEDHGAYEALLANIGDKIERWPGERVRLEVSDGRIVGAVREAAPDRTVEICKTEIVQRERDSIIVCTLCDAENIAEGFLEIIYESEDPRLQERGQGQLARLCSAVGIGELEDTAALEFVPFQLTASGEFLRPPPLLAEAA